jgi:hypothetical protein
MKKSILIICLSLFAFGSSFAGSSDINSISKEETKTLRPCTITIKGNFDGVEVDLEVTVDASRLECYFLKKGVRDAMKQ